MQQSAQRDWRLARSIWRRACLRIERMARQRAAAREKVYPAAWLGTLRPGDRARLVRLIAAGTSNARAGAGGQIRVVAQEPGARWAAGAVIVLALLAGGAVSLSSIGPSFSAPPGVGAGEIAAPSTLDALPTAPAATPLLASLGSGGSDLSRIAAGRADGATPAADSTAGPTRTATAAPPATAAPIVAAPGPAADRPRFVLGFAQLKERLGNVMGDPVENEHGNADNCDTQQQTTRGLAYWQCSTGTVTFAALPDGQQHWALIGDQLVTWTGPSPDPPDGASEVPTDTVGATDGA